MTIDIVSPEAGVLEKYVAKEGETVEPGMKITVILKGAQGVATAATPEKAAPQPPPAEKSMEEKKEIKVESIPPPPPPSSPTPSKHTAIEPRLPPKERERRVPMTRLKKRVASRLKDSHNTFALLTTFNEIDMTNLMKLRADYKDAFVEKHGVKLGFMSGFVKAAISALQQQPTVNSRRWKNGVIGIELTLLCSSLSYIVYGRRGTIGVFGTSFVHLGSAPHSQKVCESWN